MPDQANYFMSGPNMTARNSIVVLLPDYASAMMIQHLQRVLNIIARKARNLVLQGEIPAFKNGKPVSYYQNGCDIVFDGLLGFHRKNCDA